MTLVEMEDGKMSENVIKTIEKQIENLNNEEIETCIKNYRKLTKDFPRDLIAKETLKLLRKYINQR